MKTRYAKVKEWRHNTKIKLFQGFSCKCCLCGLEDDPIIYDFHHLDPGTKELRISSKISSWETIVEEAKKCVMLCSHCHRKVHYRDLSIDKPIMFDESLVTSQKNNRWGFK
jgi:hypothetical protein